MNWGRDDQQHSHVPAIGAKPFSQFQAGDTRHVMVRKAENPPSRAARANHDAIRGQRQAKLDRADASEDITRADLKHAPGAVPSFPLPTDADGRRPDAVADVERGGGGSC